MAMNDPMKRKIRTEPGDAGKGAINRASADISAELASVMVRLHGSEQGPVESQVELQKIVEIIGRISGVDGALLLTLDKQGHPFALNTAGTDIFKTRIDHDLNNAPKLFQSHEKTDDFWFPVLHETANHPLSTINACTLRCDHDAVALLALGARPSSANAETMEAIQGARDVLVWSILNIIERSEKYLTSRAFKLATEEMAKFRFDAMADPAKDRGDLFRSERIIESIKKVFCSSRASLWVREHGHLHPANHSKKDVAALEIEQRIADEIGHFIKVDSPQELKADWLITNLPRVEIPAPIQRRGKITSDFLSSIHEHFLAAPLRIGQKINGIVFLFRDRNMRNFTIYEQALLGNLCALLGAHYSFSRWIYIARSIFQTDKEAICVSCWDSKSRVPEITYANPGAFKLFGNKLKLYQDARKLYADDEVEKVNKKFREAKAEDINSFSIKRIRLDKDTEQRWIDASYTMVRSLVIQEGVKYMVGIMRDVTDTHTESEQRRRLLELLKAKGIAYFRADHEGYTIETSPAEIDITGYSRDTLVGPSDETGGRGLHRSKLYMDPLEREQLVKEIEDKNGGLVRNLQHLCREDEDDFWAEGDFRTVRQGRTGIEGLYEDVTDRIRLQNFLDAGTDHILRGRELSKKLEEKVGFQIDYLASLGHQLQVPLASVVENLINFREGIINQSKIDRRFDQIIGEARICAMMTRTFASMEKILSKSLPDKERDLVRFYPLVVEIVNNFQYRLYEKDIEIRFKKENIETLLNINGSKNLLRQVISNLVDNAIKYSWEGTKIKVNAHHWPDGRVFEIVNEGFPISDEAKEQIFNRGFRSPEAKAWVPHGTGLGLWLVRMIIEAHDARIHCVNGWKGKETMTAFQVIFPDSDRRRSF